MAGQAYGTGRMNRMCLMHIGNLALPVSRSEKGGGFKPGLLLPAALATALVLAALSPAPFRVMVASSVLLLIGFVSALVIHMRAKTSDSARWDQSAVLVFAGFAAALIADPDLWLTQ